LHVLHSLFCLVSIVEEKDSEDGCQASRQQLDI
jgi:hypothetical protein